MLKTDWDAHNFITFAEGNLALISVILNGMSDLHEVDPQDLGYFISGNLQLMIDAKKQLDGSKS